MILKLGIGSRCFIEYCSNVEATRTPWPNRARRRMSSFLGRNCLWESHNQDVAEHVPAGCQHGLEERKGGSKKRTLGLIVTMEVPC